MTLFFGILLLLAGIANFVFTVMILRELAAENKPLGFFDLRWYILKNLGTYKNLTRSRYGRVGIAYYGYLATLLLLLLAAALCLASLSR